MKPNTLTEPNQNYFGSISILVFNRFCLILWKLIKIDLKWLMLIIFNCHRHHLSFSNQQQSHWQLPYCLRPPWSLIARVRNPPSHHLSSLLVAIRLVDLNSLARGFHLIHLLPNCQLWICSLFQLSTFQLPIKRSDFSVATDHICNLSRTQNAHSSSKSIQSAASNF